MAYESKLFIVKKYPRTDSEGKEIGQFSRIDESKNYAQIIAMYDICEFEPIRKLFHPGEYGETGPRPTDCYIYAADGDTETHKDCYGDPLIEASVADVIQCLAKLRGEDKKYRRVPPLLGLLRGFQEVADAGEDWDGCEVVVLHYGH